MRRFRSVIGSWALVLFSTFLTLAVFEIGLRLFAPQYGNFVQPDDLIEYSFVPGATYVFLRTEPCPGWGSAGRINSHGLRDREYGYAKPPDTYRILALGDSYTEGFQFALEKTWTKLLERRLNERGGGVKYEVINAGRSAMGTGTQYLYYVERGRRYKPDLVLVLFIPNDFPDNIRDLGGRLQPYFYVSGEELVVDRTFTQRWPYRVRKWVHALKFSYLVSFAAQSYNRLRPQLQRPERSGNIRSDTLTSREQSAIDVTQRLLLALSDAVDRDNGRFAVVIGTANFEVNWTDTAAPEKNHDFLTTNADRIITSFAEQQRLPYLDLEPVLRSYSANNRALIHGCPENRGGGHWSEIGHAVAADAIYRFLTDQALVP